MKFILSDVTHQHEQSPYWRQGHKCPLQPQPGPIANRRWVALATRSRGRVVVFAYIKHLRSVILIALAAVFFTGCIGKIVSAPFKIVGEVIDTVLP